MPCETKKIKSYTPINLEKTHMINQMPSKGFANIKSCMTLWLKGFRLTFIIKQMDECWSKGIQWEVKIHIWLKFHQGIGHVRDESESSKACNAPIIFD